jgi:hypothetical protein
MTCEADGERASPISSAFPSYRIQSMDVENPLFPLEIRQFNQKHNSTWDGNAISRTLQSYN